MSPFRGSSVLERSLSDEVLYGRASDHLRIFVSSKMRDRALDRERAAVIRAIDALPPHRAWAWERDSNAGPYSAARVCVKRAKTADGLVLILDDELTRVTRLEYNAAKRASLPVFIFVKARSTRTPDAAAFVAREQRHAVTKTFRNVSELRTHVRSALSEYSLYAHRQWILAGRIRAR